MTAVPFVLFGLAEQRVSSVLAGLVNATTPLFTALAVGVLVPSERPDRVQVGGLVVGFAGGDIPKLPLNLPLLKGASLVGVFWGEFARRDPRGNARNLMQLAAWVESGMVNPLVSERYPLERTPEGLRALLERRVTGKVVVTP